MNLDFRLSLEPSLTQCVDLYLVLQVMSGFSSLGKCPYLKISLLEPCSKPFGRQLEIDGIVFRGHVAAPKYERICSSCAPLSSLRSFSWRCIFGVGDSCQFSRGWQEAEFALQRLLTLTAKLGILFTEVCCDSAGRAEGHLPVNCSEI